LPLQSRKIERPIIPSRASPAYTRYHQLDPFFSETILAAQQATLERIDFFIQKTTFYDRFRGHLNERQEKVIACIFKEGITGFRGGLSAENYIAITATSRATATRDLQQLAEIGALMRSGERRHTRYALLLRS